MLARSQRDGDAGQNYEAARDLPGCERGSQPGPFDERAQRRGETLNQQQREARAEPRQGLEEGHVTDADAQDATEEKGREGVAGQSDAESVSPHAEHESRHRQPPEIRLGAADQFGRAMAAHDRDREEDGGKKSRKHAPNAKQAKAESRAAKLQEMRGRGIRNRRSSRGAAT